MRTYRIYIPLILLIASILLFTRNTFSEAVLIHVTYNQLTKDAQKQIDCQIGRAHV